MKTFNQPLLAASMSDSLHKRVLGFKYQSNGEWIAEITIGAFRPLGLMVWDAPQGGWLTQTLISNTLQVIASWDPIPIDFFTMAKSYEQIEQLLTEGVEPPTWPDFDAAQLGTKIYVKITNSEMKVAGPPTRIAMWGLQLLRH